MPRHESATPVTARVLAVLGVDVEGRPTPERAARGAAYVRPDERATWGWIPDPPDGADDPEEAGSGAGGGGERRVGRHRQLGGPPLFTTPMSLRGARIHVSWRAVLALVVVLVVSALVFVVRVARAEQSAAPQPVSGATTPSGVVGRSLPSAFATTGAGGAASGGGSGASGSGTAKPPGAQVRMIMVHVVGQVARPGVVTLAEGARIVDAIALAGGALPGADVQHVNLARVLLDGEQVYVPKPGESVPAAGGAVGGSTGAAGGAGGAAGAVIDLNSADVTALDTLPGVGPVLAQRIVDWRTEHGRFNTVDELGEVSGIGDKLLSEIRPKVRV